MYHKLKNIVTHLIPRKILFNQEENLRKIYAVFYSGDSFQCNICEKKLRRFISTSNDDLLCPNCGSLQRNRLLWHLIETEFLIQGQSILDFSPSRCLYRKLKKNSAIDYQSTDLSGDFIADHHFDITNLEAADDTYDLVLCYHVLEHIEDDNRAMKELYRVMKLGATALVQTPFKSGDIYENTKIVSEVDRLEHFGQEDHVRVYSVSGLKNRLESCGFVVNVRNNFRDNYYGLNSSETVLVLSKPKKTN